MASRPPSYNDFAVYHHNAGEITATNSRSAAARASVVDRALYGEPVPTWLQPKEKSNWQGPSGNKYDLNASAAMRGSSNGMSPQDQLAELYEVDLIGKLDGRMQQAGEPQWQGP